MCCLFGFYDYGRSLSAKQKSRLVSALSVAAEVRGTDATGIAYLTLESGCAGTNSSLSFRPIPAARRLSVRSDGFAVPLSSLLIFVWWIPVACASWFCVRWFSSRPSMMGHGRLFRRLQGIPRR